VKARISTTKRREFREDVQRFQTGRQVVKRKDRESEQENIMATFSYSNA